MSLVTVALFSNWAGLILSPSPVRANGANMILFSDTTLPSGWTLVSGVGGDFYQKFPRGYSSYGGTGGSATHTHSVSYVSCTAPSGTGAIVEAGSAIASDSHIHNGLSSGSTSSAISLPPYRNLKIVKYSGIPSRLEAGLIGIFDTTYSGTGWTRYSAQDGKFIRGEASAGGTGGVSTHTHSVSITTTGSSASTGASGSYTPISSTSSHTHNGTGTTDLVNHEPKHVDILLYQVNYMSISYVPEGMIAMFDADPGAGWDVISDSGEVFYERYLQGESAYATGQGSATHTHGNLDITTGSPSATSQTERLTTGLGPVMDDSAGAPPHTHTVTVSFGSADNLPPYKNVIIAKKKPAVFKSQDWRWYDAENVEDPANTNGSDNTTGNSMANENTAPSSTRIIYDGNAIKLRFKIAETGGGYLDDVRFRLQFDTDSGFSAPTYVAEQGATGATDTWRYYDGAGTDDAIITNTRLSGSPSAGTHNEAGAAASTFDFAANTTYEFEFTIQLNPATPIHPPTSATYYFRACYNHALGSGSIPTDSGETYPSLTTSAAFDLEVQTVPNDVELGTYQKGSNGTDGGTLSYTFNSAEKIVFWDKTGSSNGWSLSVESTDLSGATDTIPKGDIRWISATASLNGSFASDTTGITGQAGAMLDQSRTAYVADSSEGEGGFFFQPTVEVTQLNNRDIESYSGTLTLTLA